MEAPTTLQINVHDDIIVSETIEEVIKIVTEYIQKWFDSEDSAPLTITLTKVRGQAPPKTLYINVNDSVGVAGGLV